MRLSELEAVVESLLFIAGDAVSLASIAQTIELDQATTRAVVLSLADKYEKEKRTADCGDCGRVSDVYGGRML